MAKLDRPAPRAQDDSVSDAATQAPASAGRVIILQADWGEYLAGRVLRADADIQSALAAEGVAHRDATDQERAIAGIG